MSIARPALIRQLVPSIAFAPEGNFGIRIVADLGGPFINPFGFQPGAGKVTPKRWALLAWGAFLVILIGAAAIDGGRNCEVPRSGPFHWLLKGREYVETPSLKSRCSEVSPHSSEKRGDWGEPSAPNESDAIGQLRPH